MNRDQRIGFVICFILAIIPITFVMIVMSIGMCLLFIGCKLVSYTENLLLRLHNWVYQTQPEKQTSSESPAIVECLLSCEVKKYKKD